jgi:hypothetical protein
MKATSVPKGVWFSTFVMSFPLFAATTLLAGYAPLAHTTLVDPNEFATLARTCIRLLSLNLSFIGGIHYGLASAQWDTARNAEEEKKVTYQIGYSFVPAIMAFCSSNFLLFSSPMTV